MPEIYYFDNPETNFIFHTIASFNIKDDDDIKETAEDITELFNIPFEIKERND